MHDKNFPWKPKIVTFSQFARHACYQVVQSQKNILKRKLQICIFCPPPKKTPFNRDGKSFFQNVCSCHVTYAFQSESTLYSYLNVKELFAQSRHKIWSLSDCNWNRTQNHFVPTRTFNHLTKLALWIDWPNGLGFTLKCVCDITRTHSQIHCTDKYSEHSLSILMAYSAQVILKKLCIKENFDYLASTCETSEMCIHYLFLLHFLFLLEYYLNIQWKISFQTQNIY